MDLKVNGIFSFDEGYYYFRNIANQIFFGDAHNIDLEVENIN
jgi:hypothetical protein